MRSRKRILLDEYSFLHTVFDFFFSRRFRVGYCGISLNILPYYKYFQFVSMLSPSVLMKNMNSEFHERRLIYVGTGEG